MSSYMEQEIRILSANDSSFVYCIDKTNTENKIEVTNSIIDYLTDSTKEKIKNQIFKFIGKIDISESDIVKYSCDCVFIATLHHKLVDINFFLGKHVNIFSNVPFSIPLNTQYLLEFNFTKYYRVVIDWNRFADKAKPEYEMYHTFFNKQVYANEDFFYDFFTEKVMKRKKFDLYFTFVGDIAFVHIFRTNTITKKYNMFRSCLDKKFKNIPSIFSIENTIGKIDVIFFCDNFFNLFNQNLICYDNMNIELKNLFNIKKRLIKELEYEDIYYDTIYYTSKLMYYANNIIDKRICIYDDKIDNTLSTFLNLYNGIIYIPKDMTLDGMFFIFKKENTIVHLTTNLKLYIFDLFQQPTLEIDDSLVLLRINSLVSLLCYPDFDIVFFQFSEIKMKDIMHLYDEDKIETIREYKMKESDSRLELKEYKVVDIIGYRKQYIVKYIRNHDILEKTLINELEKF